MVAGREERAVLHRHVALFGRNNEDFPPVAGVRVFGGEPGEIGGVCGVLLERVCRGEEGVILRRIRGWLAVIVNLRCVLLDKFLCFSSHIAFLQGMAGSCHRYESATG